LLLSYCFDHCIVIIILYMNMKTQFGIIISSHRWYDVPAISNILSWRVFFLRFSTGEFKFTRREMDLKSLFKMIMIVMMVMFYDSDIINHLQRCWWQRWLQHIIVTNHYRYNNPSSSVTSFVRCCFNIMALMN